MNLETSRQYVWHGVTWATGKPTLLLANTATGLLDQIEVMGLELGLKVSNPARFCTGRYRFADTFHVEPVPCPWQAEAGNGGQCPKCLEQDEFRFAHQFHKGGYAPPTLAAYMSQPHWLYVATHNTAPGQLTHLQRMEILQKAYDKVDKTQVNTTSWLVVVQARAARRGQRGT